MAEIPISQAPPTLLQEPDGSREALASASSDEEIAEVAATYPQCLAAWAELGGRALARNAHVEAYAYFRVGYHRGLDRLRKSGWRGSGEVPWSHEPNRGFLKSLAGLGRAAGAIGEMDEAERCAEFFQELAPDAPSP
ncbi:MAG: DUF3151 domain-containing protein [Actinomycetota bacterium]|nr:DUF3151 domain-containing protein [Actinomycetota bacterium]